MKISKNDGLSYYQRHQNYCARCWVEFTTLTDEERENLKKRARLFKQFKQSKHLFT